MRSAVWWLGGLLLVVGCGEGRSPSGAAGGSASGSAASGGAGRSEAGTGGRRGSAAASGGAGRVVAGQAAAGGGDSVGAACEAHRARTASFLVQHRSCAADADCVVVGACSGGFGFEAVSAAAATQAQAFSDATPPGCQAFDGPTYRAVCERASSASEPGSCKLRELSRACGQAAPVLCDGSNDIRFGFTLGGWYANASYAFTNPYGRAFAAIDGQCRYYVSRNFMEGTFSGTLTDEQAAALTDELGYEGIESWSGDYGLNCADAVSVTLATPTATLTCVCGGCDGAPEGAGLAVNRLSDWLARLIREGTPLDGAVSAWAEPSATPPPWSTARAWPLGRPLADFPGLVATEARSGERFELPVDAKALRDLRKDTFAASGSAQWVLVQDGSAADAYQLYVRDELPGDRVIAVGDFFELVFSR